MKQKVVMGLSGGMDSTTVLTWLLNQGYEVHCCNFVYGSKHNEYEEQAAENVAKKYKVPYHVFNLTEAFKPMKSNLLKSGGDIPEGHYEEESMSQTVVPGRNSIFATIMCGVAESIGASFIALGVHQGDHAIYPDCRVEYVKALDTLIYLASDRKVQLLTPFLNTDKYGILEYGFKHDTPYHLTRTCYKDQKTSCGKCGSCGERIEAFRLHGTVDPIIYDGLINWDIDIKDLKGDKL